MKIGVIGAGLMGCDVSLAVVANGHDVVLVDLNEKVCEDACSRMAGSVRLYKMGGHLPKNFDKTIIEKNVTFSTDYSKLTDCELVIENVTEDLETKLKVYQKLNMTCSETTVFAVNTSCISITKIASDVKNPQRVIGAHFMNPVPMKKLVETVRGYNTSDQTVEKLNSFLESIGKTSVVVNDYPGFVANRLSHLFMNEAAFLVQDNVGTPQQIDTIFKLGYGHAMGPLETADLIGLDTVVNSLKVLYDSYQDSKFRCCPLLKKMVDAGLLGKKVSKGFYNY